MYLGQHDEFFDIADPEDKAVYCVAAGNRGKITVAPQGVTPRALIKFAAAYP